MPICNNYVTLLLRVATKTAKEIKMKLTKKDRKTIENFIENIRIDITIIQVCGKNKDDDDHLIEQKERLHTWIDLLEKEITK